MLSYQTQMTYNPNRAHQPSLTSPIAVGWSQFISLTIPPGKLPEFPKTQIVEYTRGEGAPRVKQLMQLLPHLLKYYWQDCKGFGQLLVALYILTMKGCVSTNYEFVHISMEFLQQLLQYRILIICRAYDSNSITQLYGWLDNWLGLFVPAVLATMNEPLPSKSNQPHSSKEPITFISILKQVNKSNFSQNSVILLFECLLVSKLRSHLSPSSLFQFDSILRRIYCPQKFSQVYQGKGCTSHIPRDQGCKDILGMGLVQISDLVPARLHQLNWQIYELELQHNDRQEVCLREYSKLRKVKSDSLLQPWVVDCYVTGAKPSPVKINLNTLLLKMKTMQIYRFLCLLEVYGSSPNIDVLNDYILDEKVLQLFTKFLLADNLAEHLFSLNKLTSGQTSLEYSYRNEKFIHILEKLASCATQISNHVEKNLLIQQLSTKLFVEDSHRGKTDEGQERDPNERQPE